MDYKWLCSDCEKILKCRYFKWVNIINKFYTNPDRIIVECQHYVKEINEK